MKLLILATLLLGFMVGCGQIGQLKPAEPAEPAAETVK